MDKPQKYDLVPAILGGKGSNGYERDKGAVVHAVEVINPHFMDLSDTAACGKRHGARSIGYLARKELTVNCPKCIKAMKKVKAWAVCDPYIIGEQQIVEYFDTKEQAEAWLESKIVSDEGGYVGCVIMPKADARFHYGK
jgi:hypothetical protein